MRAVRAELNTLLDEYGRAHDSVDITLKLPLVFQNEAPNADDPPTIGTAQTIIDSLKRYEELGASHFVLDVTPETLQACLDTMERFAQEIRPKL